MTEFSPAQPTIPDPAPETIARAGRLVKSSFAAVKVKKVPEYQDVRPALTMRSRPQEFFERCVSAAWLAHISGKGVSAPSIQSEDSGLPLARIRDILETPRFQAAMETRGIPKADMTHLSDEMVMALSVLRDTSLMLSEREKLRKVGIPWERYLGWKEYPPFKRKYSQLMRGALDGAVERGDLKLAELIDQGNLKAIEYANEKTGTFVRGGQQIQSMEYLISMVLATVKKHVTDQDTLLELVKDFSALSQQNSLAPPQLEILEAVVVEESDEYTDDVDEDHIA